MSAWPSWPAASPTARLTPPWAADSQCRRSHGSKPGPARSQASEAAHRLAAKVRALPVLVNRTLCKTAGWRIRLREGTCSSHTTTPARDRPHPAGWPAAAVAAAAVSVGSASSRDTTAAAVVATAAVAAAASVAVAKAAATAPGGDTGAAPSSGAERSKSKAVSSQTRVATVISARMYLLNSLAFKNGTHHA